MVREARKRLVERSTEVVTAAAADGEEESCSLCLEAMWGEEDVLRLSCSHKYHRRCVYGWLVEKRRNDCPLCRADVVGVVVAGVHAGVVLHPMW